MPKAHMIAALMLLLMLLFWHFADRAINRDLGKQAFEILGLIRTIDIGITTRATEKKTGPHGCCMVCVPDAWGFFSLLGNMLYLLPILLTVHLHTDKFPSVFALMQCAGRGHQ
ncbi:hypothetical protein F5Y01DRAFT_265810 [Xylaria sp. FL0043]|nr:hypothetical protein F5Y01DRAFT_265810 [Xylaria sp. FL0043]